MNKTEGSSHNPRRGQVWLVCLNPQTGVEIDKKRAAVILSLDAIGSLPLRIVVPLTDWSPQYSESPWLVNLKPSGANGLSNESAADAFQAKSIPLHHFEQCLGRVEAAQLDEITQAVALCIGA